MQIIEHEQTDHRGAFFVEEEGKRLAQLTYTVAGTKIILDHTEIDDSLRGTGTGRKLVAAAVDVEPGLGGELFVDGLLAAKEAHY